jgi:hypothetical protein
MGRRASSLKQPAGRLRRDQKMPNKDDSNGPADGETPESAAHYIAALSGELAKIARRHGFDTLSEILEIARLEADQAAKQ